MYYGVAFIYLESFTYTFLHRLSATCIFLMHSSNAQLFLRTWLITPLSIWPSWLLDHTVRYKVVWCILANFSWRLVFRRKTEGRSWPLDYRVSICITTVFTKAVRMAISSVKTIESLVFTLSSLLLIFRPLPIGLFSILGSFY